MLVLTIIKALSIPALVLLNAFFVAAEFALVAVRKTQIEEMVRAGQRGSRTLEKQKQNINQAIAAVQLGITLASLGLGWMGEPALAHLIEPFFDGLPAGWKLAASHTLASAIVFFLITFVLVAFGELAPKAIALQQPATVALWAAIPLEIFTRLTRPIVVSMNAVGNWVVRLLGFQAIGGEQMVHSVDELTMLVDEVEEAGLLSSDQAEYVQNVFQLSEKKVGDCMVPNEEVAALELTDSPERIMEIVRNGAHTRLPVYEGSINNIVGIVNTKDLFYLFSLKGVVILQDALYPPVFLMEGQSIRAALRLFRRVRRPMALVRSGQGHVIGLITLEDILEEIVGDIEDEHDPPRPAEKPSSEGDSPDAAKA